MDVLSDKIVKIRKPHMCNACGRLFEAGTLMRTQVQADNGIQTWRECPTCMELLSKHRNHFRQYDDFDDICLEFCVNEELKCDQTPESLLYILNDSNKK